MASFSPAGIEPRRMRLILSFFRNAYGGALLRIRVAAMGSALAEVHLQADAGHAHAHSHRWRGTFQRAPELNLQLMKLVHLHYTYSNRS